MIWGYCGVGITRVCHCLDQCNPYEKRGSRHLSTGEAEDILRVLHVITGLGPGGAEHMLWRLVAATPELSHAVFSLSGAGVLSPMLTEAGAEVLNKRERGRSDWYRDWPKLLRYCRSQRPDIIQGWMSHGNLAAVNAKAFAPGAALMWNIRQQLPLPSMRGPVSNALLRVHAVASRWPDAIIYNSHSAAVDYEGIGYSGKHRVVLPNGFDTEAFRPDPGNRQAMREALGLAGDQIAIGLIARFDPWKNHEGFFRVATRIRERNPEAVFVLAGKGTEASNPEIQALIGPQLAGNVRLLGDRRDVPAIYSALDAACNVSFGEGFPNAVGEAMACGVPCVVTPVGASQWLVGDCGVVARGTDDESLYDAFERMLGLGPQALAALGSAARARIVEHFSIAAVAEQYVDLYRQVR